MKRIVCFGPGPQFKGGIANYTLELAKALDAREGIEVHLVSWTQQYPQIIPRNFSDTSSKKNLLDGTDIQIKYITDYNNPLTWRATVDYIAGLRPDKVIFQWAISIQGLPMGAIAKGLKKACDAELIFDLHNIIQKEGSFFDAYLTKRGIAHADTYIVHSLKTVEELNQLIPDNGYELSYDGSREKEKTILKLFHPIYNLYAEDPDFDVEGYKKEHGLKKHVFLFFGFIRKYKGLHNVIEAFAQLRKERDDVSLLICGESFWNLDDKKLSTKVKNALFGLAKKVLIRKKDDDSAYNPLELVDTYGLQDDVMIVNEFIPNEDVHKYFQVCDAVMLYYDYATPSGIESLSYNFKKPILATRVGPFEESIEEGQSGYLATPNDISSMADTMLRLIEYPIAPEKVEAKTRDLSWEKYVDAILTS